MYSTNSDSHNTTTVAHNMNPVGNNTNAVSNTTPPCELLHTIQRLRPNPEGYNAIPVVFNTCSGYNTNPVAYNPSPVAYGAATAKHIYIYIHTRSLYDMYRTI